MNRRVIEMLSFQLVLSLFVGTALAEKQIVKGDRRGRPTANRVTENRVAERHPPNFVLILVDDLGWTDLGCQGSKYYETSNIDRLARQGMRFTNAYAACAVCSPSRAAVQTGRYPARLGITDWIRMWFQTGPDVPGDPEPPEYELSSKQKLLCPTNCRHLELDEISLAESLKPAGYVCGHIGKWHLGQEVWFPQRQGYDFNLGGCDLGLPGNYFDPYAFPADWHNFPYFKQLYNEKADNIPTLPPRRKGEYLTDREADEAVDFIKAHKDKPFFLNMCHYAVHSPIQAKPGLVAKYKAKPKSNHDNPAYAAMIHSVDESVGRILATLDELDLAERTVVLITSDNGGLLPTTDNTPLRAGKAYPYEGGIRVPLIVRWPGAVPPGSTSSLPVSGIDFFPTFLDIAGIPLPEDRSIDGLSLISVLKQTGTFRRDALYWHYPHYFSGHGEGIKPYSIIRAGEWKLIRHYEDNRLELFNLAEDLGEKRDLAAKLPEKARQLNEQLSAWLESVGAKLPKPREISEQTQGRIGQEMRAMHFYPEHHVYNQHLQLTTMFRSHKETRTTCPPSTFSWSKTTLKSCYVGIRTSSTSGWTSRGKPA